MKWRITTKRRPCFREIDVVKLDYLANHQSVIPVLSKWYFDEWGHLSPGNSPAKISANLNDYLNTNKVPLIIIAFNDSELIGAAQLKFREMSIYPNREHWLGGVYVSDIHRGNNIAETIIDELVIVAKRLGVRTLNLQTEFLNGGLYKRLGWEKVENVNYRDTDVLVMKRLISN